MVYYRKYRPQKISDLDSSVVREKLLGVLGSASVPHAFLFTGPKGLGKTSAARIVAKVVNCEAQNVILSTFDKLSVNSAKDLKNKKDSSATPQNDKTVEPCNKCSQCTSITNGTNLDILEIDGASNRGIDEIRDLREKIGFAPFSARKKIYIIDEVHMLTSEAFNALLKTLEEPPGHALFVLCTTEPHKVPETILSRCFHIAFTKATSEELVRSFERILKSEKIPFNKEALLQIASLSDGSFRDGAKILEDVVRLADGKGITKELVENKFQISNIQSQISNMLSQLQKKDAKASLLLISELVEQGIDMKYFIEQLINELHGMLLAKIGIENRKSMENDPPADGWKMEDIKHLVELLTKAHADFKYAVIPQLPLELVIIEWASISEHSEDSDKPATQKLQKVRESEPPIVRHSDSHSFSDLPAGKAGFSGIWQKLIDRVKQENQSVAGVLRGCTISSYDTEELVIETKYKFHKERLEEKTAQVLLERVTQEVFGNKLKITIMLTGK